MIRGIDLDTAYLYDSLYHYNFVAECSAVKKKYPNLSDQNICLDMGINPASSKRVALLFNFDLQSDADFDKPYFVESFQTANTQLLILTPDTLKTSKNRHQLLYGWHIPTTRAHRGQISYAYKTATISDKFINCHFMINNHFNMGDIDPSAKCTTALIETVARRPYLINYGKSVSLSKADDERGQIVYMDNARYTGPTLDAYPLLLAGISKPATQTSVPSAKAAPKTRQGTTHVRRVVTQPKKPKIKPRNTK